MPTHEPADEIDVEFDEEGAPEGAECVGTYASIAAYLRAMLEPEVSSACAWVLEHVDYEAVRRRCERDGVRLVIVGGQVYRVVIAEDGVMR